MKKTALLAVAIATTLTLSGCMTVAGPVIGSALTRSNDQPASQAEDTPGTDKRRVAKSAGIGCAVGAVGAFILGRKDDALVGCAAGAVIGGVASYRKQLKEAREVEQAARDAGWSAEVRTREVEAKDGKTEAFDGLVINYDPASMSQMTDKTKATMSRLARLLDAAKEPVTIRFEGERSACTRAHGFLAEAKALDRHMVELACGRGTNRLVITPVPQVD